MSPNKLNILAIEKATQELVNKPSLILSFFEPKEKKNQRQQICDQAKEAVRQIQSEKLSEEKRCLTVRTQLDHERRVAIAKQAHEMEMQQLQPQRQDALNRTLISSLESKGDNLQRLESMRGQVSADLLQACQETVEEIHFNAAQRLLDANDFDS